MLSSDMAKTLNQIVAGVMKVLLVLFTVELVIYAGLALAGTSFFNAAWWQHLTAQLVAGGIVAFLGWLVSRRKARLTVAVHQQRYSPQSAQNVAPGATVVQIQGNENEVSINGKPFLRIHTLADRMRRFQRLGPTMDLALLQPESPTVELIGRDEDLSDFIAWLDAEHPISLRVIVGGAGVGKTRFAIELLKELERRRPSGEEWFAGFLRLDDLRSFDMTQTLAEANWPAPSLLIVDYAATEAELLRKWITFLAEFVSEASRIRILMLERTDSFLATMVRYGGGTDPGIANLFHPPEGMTLQPISKEDASRDRRRLLQAALDAYARRKNKTLPPLPEPRKNEWFDLRLEDPQWGDPLYLLMAAAVAVESEIATALSMSRTDLAQKLAQREIHTQVTRGATDESARRLRTYLAACSTLSRGLTKPQALAIAEVVHQQTQLDYPGGTGALVEDLAGMLPEESGGIGNITPDIIGEAFVGLGFKKGQWPLDDAQVDAILLASYRQKGADAMRLLIPLIQDYAVIWSRQNGGELQSIPLWPETLDWLAHLVEHGRQQDVSLLMSISNNLPRESLVLRERAADIEAMIVDQLRSGETTPEILGIALNNLGIRLSDLGRGEEALKAAQEAVEIHRPLAKDRPDAFLPNLAASLTNLGASLSNLGRREEALKPTQEAVEIYRALARDRPDAFLPALAMSLNNLGAILGEVGRREEALKAAQEAVEIYRALARDRPDAFLPALAMSINNLGNRLSELGRREEALKAAQEAVEIRRALARDRPDAFLPDLAASLNNLGAMLSELGRREEAIKAAQEAGEIYRALAKDRPDAFLPDLAMSLSNLGTRLGALGRCEEALKAAQESVEIRRALAKDRPDAFLPDLAASLNNLGIRLGALGRREEALKAAQEAGEIYGALAKDRPGAFLPDLAMSLNNLGIRLGALGRREEALEVTQEAVEIYRPLAKDRPDAFLPDLAGSLGSLARRLRAATKLHDALEAFAEGVRTLRPRFLSLPAAFTQLMGGLVDDYITLSRELGQEPDRELLEPIIAKFEEMKPSGNSQEQNGQG